MRPRRIPLNDRLKSTVPRVSGQRTTLLIVAVALCLASGCGPPELETTYGVRRAAGGAQSVNGTSVLAGMFEAAGHRVSTWRRMSPRLDQFDTIVWIPNDFAPPSDEHREFLENWLSEQAGRTVIYVGRDYDAAEEYWRRALRNAPAEDVLEIRRRLARAQAHHDTERMTMPADEDADWFRVKRQQGPRRATSFSSPDADWLDGIDSSRLSIHLEGVFEYPEQSGEEGEEGGLEQKPLLQAGEEVLVMQLEASDWYGSKLLVCVNGSFLLNMPLVNPEHRKLAARIIEQCGEPGEVVFLESGPGGPLIFDQEPELDIPSATRLLTMWPTGLFWLHLAVLGILYCFMVFPIFGRPRKLEDTATADFGKHVEALGELLERTGDRDYAWNRLRHYQQLHGETAAAHEKQPVQPHLSEKSETHERKTMGV